MFRPTPFQPLHYNTDIAPADFTKHVGLRTRTCQWTKILCISNKTTEAFSFFCFCWYQQSLLTPTSWHFTHQQSATHAWRKYIHLVWKTWTENWNICNFSFLAFFLSTKFVKSGKQQKSEKFRDIQKVGSHAKSLQRHNYGRQSLEFTAESSIRIWRKTLMS